MLQSALQSELKAKVLSYFPLKTTTQPVFESWWHGFFLLSHTFCPHFFATKLLAYRISAFKACIDAGF